MSSLFMILPVFYLAAIGFIFFFAFKFLKTFESIAESLRKLEDKK